MSLVSEDSYFRMYIYMYVLGIQRANGVRSNVKHWKECFIQYSNTSKLVKENLSTHFSVFGNWMEHSSLGLYIYYIYIFQMCIVEKWNEIPDCNGGPRCPLCRQTRLSELASLDCWQHWCKRRVVAFRTLSLPLVLIHYWENLSKSQFLKQNCTCELSCQDSHLSHLVNIHYICQHTNFVILLTFPKLFCYLEVTYMFSILFACKNKNKKNK